MSEVLKMCSKNFVNFSTSNGQRQMVAIYAVSVAGRQCMVNTSQ